MPGWHKAIERYQKDDTLKVVGIIQEQHPDRCKLYMQWQQMDWPVMVDSLNLLGVKAVPLTYGIDEHGVVRGRYRRFERKSFEKDFLNASFEKPEELPERVQKPDPMQLSKLANKRSKPDTKDIGATSAFVDAHMAAGVAWFLWGKGEERYTSAANHFDALQSWANSGRIHFRLGVALRAKWETEGYVPEDFTAAVQAWEKALELVPSQYIWRRRIEQYGPELSKPYPFYNWVSEAREKIRERDEEPHPLKEEPRGTELAGRAAKPEKTKENETQPDPEGKVPLDAKGCVSITAGSVPGSAKQGHAVRVHVTLALSEGGEAKWDVDMGKGELWLHVPEGWQINQKLHPLSLGNDGTMRVDVELIVAGDAKVQKHELSGTAWYYVCSEADSQCEYLRQSFTFEVEVKGQIPPPPVPGNDDR